MLIKAGKTYRTRDGSKAHVWKTDMRCVRPIAGWVEYHMADRPHSWANTGRLATIPNSELALDLIAPWEDDGKPVLSSRLIKALPEWANWVAMDGNGKWYWFDGEPRAVDRLVVWALNTLYGEIPAAYAPDWTGDWRDSLVEVVR